MFFVTKLMLLLKNKLEKSMLEDYKNNDLIKASVKNRLFKMWMMPRFKTYYLDRDYEPYSSKLVLKYVKKDTYFVDIGAHYGYYSLLVASENKDVKILSIEPSPHTFKILNKNIKDNGYSNVIKSEQYAISDKSGRAKFLVTEASDSSGLFGHPSHKVLDQVDVEVKKADELLVNKTVSLIKIDTEGVEISVLDGLKETIERNKDLKIIVEFNPRCLKNAGKSVSEFFKKINDLGFCPFLIDDENNSLTKLSEENILATLDWDKHKTCNFLCVKKKKVQNVVVFSHTGGYGGSERSLLEMIDELDEKGVIVHAVFPKWANGGKLIDWCEQRGVDVLLADFNWWCSPNENEQNKSVLESSSKAILQIFNELKRWDSDVVISNTITIPWGSMYAKIASKPHLWIIREFADLDFNLNYFLPKKDIYSIINSNSNYILTNSKATLNYFKKKIRKNRIDYTYVYIPEPPTRYVLEEVSLPPKPNLRLLISGAIHHSKGQIDAVKALLEMKDKGYSIDLILLGWKDNDYLKEINEIIEKNKLKNINIFEPVDNVYPYISSSDVIIVSSKNEAFGRVTVEAMQLKKPIIGTNSGATSELVKDMFNGLLYEPGNSHDLALKIEKLYLNKNLRIKLGLNGYSFYKKTFNKERYGGKIFKIINDLVLLPQKKSIEYLVLKGILKISDDYYLQNKKLEESLNREKNLNDILYKVVSTRIWKYANKIRVIINFIFPKNSLQRRFLKQAHSLCLFAFQYIPMLLVVRIRNFFKYLDTDTNRKSKKIVYIGHSYHAKTQSTAFLIDYLKEYFDVTVVLDETWQGQKPPNLDFIDDSYLGVVFFQMIYSPEIIKKIKNQNIIFCPMYDGSGGLSKDYWLQYKNLKFFNFSKTLHKKLINLGLNSFHLQYFPKPSQFFAGDAKKIFFWQRISSLSINTIDKLFPNREKNLKIYLHEAIDPGHTFIKPTKEQEKKFTVTYSTWFKTRDELLNLIKKSAFYIAPREHEGIGLSFLEAMAMGKAVIAVNNPTMNEYIKNNKNGYLFDLNDPKNIELSNLEEIQKKCYSFMKNGYKKWEAKKFKIIKFIKK